MTDWPRVTLASIAVEIQPGFACQPTDDSNGILQLRTNNISPDGGIDLSETKRVTVNNARIEKYSLEPGDVLFNNTNSPALVGKTAVFDDDGLFLFSNHMTRIRFATNIAEPRYIAHYLHRAWKRGSLRTLVTQWVNQAAINRYQLSSIQLPLPALSEQRRIVDILNRADRLRRLRTEADAKADRVLAALFMQTFGAPDRVWKTAALGDLLRRKKGALQSGPFGTHLHNSDFVPSGTILAVGIDNVMDGEFVLGRNRRITPEKYGTLTKYTLQHGDVLITIMGTVGRSCVFPGTPSPAICTKHVYRIQVNSAIHPEYLSATLRFSDAARTQIGAGITGQTVPGIKSDNLRRLQLSIPPVELQAQFAARKREIDAIRRGTRRGREALETLFSTLAHRAFTADLTASWRQAHMTELLQEMEQQARALAQAEPVR